MCCDGTVVVFWIDPSKKRAAHQHLLCTGRDRDREGNKRCQKWARTMRLLPYTGSPQLSGVDARKFHTIPWPTFFVSHAAKFVARHHVIANSIESGPHHGDVSGHRHAVDGRADWTRRNDQGLSRTAASRRRPG